MTTQATIKSVLSKYLAPTAADAAATEAASALQSAFFAGATSTSTEAVAALARDKKAPVKKVDNRAAQSAAIRWAKARAAKGTSRPGDEKLLKLAEKQEAAAAKVAAKKEAAAAKKAASAAKRAGKKAGRSGKKVTRAELRDVSAPAATAAS